MNEGGRVLVVDDEEVIRDSCREVLEREGLSVAEAENAPAALDVLDQERWDVVLLDLKMPGVSGLEALKKIKNRDSEPVVIVITGYPSVQTAVEAMKWGAMDYLTKPFDCEKLTATVGRALARRDLELSSYPGERGAEDQSPSGSMLVGETPQIKEIRSLIKQVAETESTILIMGESGTGKEVVARMLHQQSARDDEPFVVVDCTTLVDSLVENELFGHVKGSFTGASETRRGRFEMAEDGTLFLDEVGSIDKGLQSKLLRAIERGEIVRVGSNEALHVDVRVIAASNTDLARAVEDGEFREDLYYRLSVVPIVLPPLRQRKEDIPLLARHFLKLHAENRNRNVRRITDEAMDVLTAHDWPGNVRELSNAIERAVVLAEGEEIVPELLLHYGFTYSPDRVRSDADVPTLEELEERHIRRVLRRTGGNKTRAAELLGIDRKTIYRKLQQFEEEESG
ncbi:MAG: sigma-54-dependent Fis family transcriptional regulator [Planctomycetes bacterium]|nr:sigma-54-dependent Fis family transcriptional regulator [Planctomycetota bacterium]